MKKIILLVKMLSLAYARVVKLFRLQITVGQELLLLAFVAFAAVAWINWRTPAPAAAAPIDKRTTLGLQELVQSLKGELEQMESKRLSQQQGALFRIKDFDLELSFVLKRSEKDSSKLEYEILTAEMERELGAEQTHKITLHMEVAPATVVQTLPSAQPLSRDDAVPLPFVPKGKGDPQ